VTPRTRLILLVVVALGWLVLGSVNLSRGRVGTGVVYLVLGVLVAGMAALVERARRRS
jgi:TM2 domain-containing membrane protein YozV